MLSSKPLRLSHYSFRKFKARLNYRKIIRYPFNRDENKEEVISNNEKPLYNDEKTLFDHRALGTSLSLFTGHPTSPGSPFFSPEGAYILQKLQSFLRAQYPLFGIQEVLTPTIYKKNLWELSGHWDNYQDDMFTVTGRGAHGIKNAETQIGEDEEYGLKPMNCPGHCLLFQSKKRSYRELPLRFAEFSALHRNELSGSLNGLTRLRRFHQDDGHIFCRPSQVSQEIEATIRFVEMVYKIFDLGSYKFVLSTRPEKHFIGEVEDWNRAEAQLEKALVDTSSTFTYNGGAGAFYGPKIDILLTDNKGAEHQMATIQLDFQLPRRLKLQYQSPAPELEAQGISTDDESLLARDGMVTPVVIHRAILGSLERFMALVVERYQGRWPFWLSPRQMMILSVGNEDLVKNYVRTLAKRLTTTDISGRPRKLDSHCFTVDIDVSDNTLVKKVFDARWKKYNIVCVVGARNMKSEKLDLSFADHQNSTDTWDVVEKIQPGSQGRIQGDTSNVHGSNPRVRLYENQIQELMTSLCDSYL